MESKTETCMNYKLGLSCINAKAEIATLNKKSFQNPCMANNCNFTCQSKNGY